MQFDSARDAIRAKLGRHHVFHSSGVIDVEVVPESLTHNFLSCQLSSQASRTIAVICTSKLAATPYMQFKKARHEEDTKRSTHPFGLIPNTAGRNIIPATSAPAGPATR